MKTKIKHLLTLLLMVISAASFSQVKPVFPRSVAQQTISDLSLKAVQYFLPPKGATPYFPAWVADTEKPGSIFITDGSDTNYPKGLYRYDAVSSTWVLVGGLQFGTLTDFNNNIIAYNQNNQPVLIPIQYDNIGTLIRMQKATRFDLGASSLSDPVAGNDLVRLSYLQNSYYNKTASDAKYQIAGTYVNTFNGRSGTVLPALGDYSFNQISNTPTTIAGYGITDAYNKTQSDARYAAAGNYVNSFNGRIGAVLPVTGDYTFSQIGSKPTTLSGYGITDGVPNTRTINGYALSSNVTLTTNDISEGATNQYFTQARARGAISASGSISYNSTTGIISYTQPTLVSTFTNDAGYLTGTTGGALYQPLENQRLSTNNTPSFTGLTTTGNIITTADNIYSIGNSTFGFGSVFARQLQSISALTLSTLNMNSIIFNQAGVERARFSSSNGNLLVNTTTDNGIDKVQVSGTINATQITTANAYTLPDALYLAHGTNTIKLYSGSAGSLSSFMVQAGDANKGAQMDIVPNGTATYSTFGPRNSSATAYTSARVGIASDTAYYYLQKINAPTGTANASTIVVGGSNNQLGGSINAASIIFRATTQLQMPSTAKGVTQATGDNTTALATDAFVNTAVANGGRKPFIITANLTLALNSDYGSWSTTQYSAALPPTAGYATDGSKIITVLARGSGGVKITVPSGYILYSNSATSHTDGTGYVTLTQNTKVQLVPDQVANTYYLQVLSGSVTVF